MQSWVAGQKYKWKPVGEYNLFMFILVIICCVMITSWRLDSFISLLNLIQQDLHLFPPQSEKKYEKRDVMWMLFFTQHIKALNTILSWSGEHIMPQSYILCRFLPPLLLFFPLVLMAECRSDEILSSINKSRYYCSAAQPYGKVEREHDAG